MSGKAYELASDVRARKVREGSGTKMNTKLTPPSSSLYVKNPSETFYGKKIEGYPYSFPTCAGQIKVSTYNFLNKPLTMMPLKEVLVTLVPFQKKTV